MLKTFLGKLLGKKSNRLPPGTENPSADSYSSGHIHAASVSPDPFSPLYSPQPISADPVPGADPDNDQSFDTADSTGDNNDAGDSGGDSGSGGDMGGGGWN